MLHRYRSPSRKVFELVNYSLFIVFSISILIPFIHVISISLSSFAAVEGNQVSLWPVEFTLQAYEKVVTNSTFIRSFVNTVFLTVINTVLVILVSLCCAYALSSKYVIGRKIIFMYILIPMFISGGLIPTYLVVNGIGLNNTFWALILPGISSAFYIIIFKNVIDQLPQEIIESAEMDGAGDYRVLFTIVLPLVLPMTMAFTIFSAVAHWNEWFGVLLYIRDNTKWTLQFQLRDILINASLTEAMEKNMIKNKVAAPIYSESLKMAALMVTVIPIIVVYPFLQKYFIHGVLVGAVKG
ncbi:carbohydrate ABC transporter permease [Paenibacillus eucommiae]|uniref:Aldouronate transport system permease protein n=1 Tax=Paenibacillus eucommiae TaxID=1355755 RepID=A0ABS4J1S0_9BACL|nr:carbohydrate ABC transporter permease [Paenibacillus eucommiae]MBP1993789.1 putative aldouronate transport system permease protein [Paenibacillus eucommiae]